MPPRAGLLAWVTSVEVFESYKLVGAGLALAGVALAQFAARSPTGAADPRL